MSRVLGAVLAGGASSRFGSDKAAAVLDGRTLLEHARAALAAVCDEVVVVGRDDVPDRPRAGLGPLGGIAGALFHGYNNGFPGVLTIACDMPEVPRGLLEALLVRALSYCSDAPVLGHWPTSLAHGLIDRIAAGSPPSRRRAEIRGARTATAAVPANLNMPKRLHPDEGSVPHERSSCLSVRRWASDIGAQPIPSPAALRNINTPADLLTL